MEQKNRNLSISYLERRWLLILLDLAAVNGGFLLGLQVRPDYVLEWQLLSNHPIWLIYLNALWLFVGYFFQIYNLETAGKLKTSLRSIWGAGLVSLLIYSFTPYLTPVLSPSRFPFYVSIFFPLFLLTIVRSVYGWIFSRNIFNRKVLIIGAGWAGRIISKAIIDHGSHVYEVVGFMDDDPEKIGKTIEVEVDEVVEDQESKIQIPVLGGRENLTELITEKNISTVVLAITRGVSGEMLQLITDSLQQGIEILPMPVLYEELTGKVPVEHIGDQWSVSIPLDHPGTGAVWHLSKRIFDLIWSMIGFLGLILIFPLISLAIILDTPGPILYSQERMGRNGKVFKVYKFRSMVTDAEQSGPVWAEENDPRITRVGKLLRKTHLDEFPQFVNILKGDMSVVGPRPERPEFIADLAQEIPFYRVRLAVKHGMAGWGLIHQGYGSSQEDALDKLQYDLYYIKHQSLWLDFYILLRTIFDAVTLGGR
jgi:exopolysaccharide biosynthesis polyprenyl glycosylphosphotransferase